MPGETGKYEVQPIEKMIMTIPGHRVIPDVDLARIYGALTKRLNERVRRKTGKFQNGLLEKSLQDTSERSIKCY